MQTANNILLASHGTEGAQAAEVMAFKLCKKGGHVHHLIVVPSLWQGMTGDDWLNNGSTRDRYRRYLETELGKEIDEHCLTVQQQSEQQGIHYHRDIQLGKPDQCLIDYSKQQAFDLVVIGSPRPKGVPGLRSRMNTETLVKKLGIHLLIVPFPDD